MKPTDRPRSQGPKTAYRLLLEYDGSRFSGWQKQGERQSAQGVRTVAGALERALHEADLQVQVLMGSGRTDAGVHAMAQVAHLHLAGSHTPSARELQRVLDEKLPSDVAVRTVVSCSPAFHARHDALERTYLYQLSLRRSAFAKPYLWWVKGSLDLKRLEEAWKLYEGNHDVAAFADLEDGEDSRCQIKACDMTREGALVLLRITAGFFLKRQVRRMVGAAVLCGLGRENALHIQRDLLEPSPQANLHWAEKAAPAAGLFLERVRYPGDSDIGALRSLVLVPN